MDGSLFVKLDVHTQSTDALMNRIFQHQIKVSKSQKHFFQKLNCPKKPTKYLTKLFLPQLHRAEFCLIFHLFFGQWSLKLLLRFSDLYQLTLFLTTPPLRSRKSTSMKYICESYFQSKSFFYDFTMYNDRYLDEIHTSVAINTSPFHSLFLMTIMFYDLTKQRFYS